ncbi:hypothetical protein C8250_030775 [Streptomyces sp. So13.3]|uniref:YrhB domain-containing protein n=1 Tax=unclassified Streptomyces TaxID=2593676 RepID=UPI001106E185|nr:MULTISPECIES: YrhB domain-containing protein [unclassified Streptomyces]MCZ4100248.1 YrhB domain-containing protein [Streptomyces sp. H39-C1]QNA75687.1 hypothetical protein C8250_030775 [Streptomyces sp. So13.3]
MSGAMTPAQRADEWLQQQYHGLVELSVPHPVAESSQAWVFGCRTLSQSGYSDTPMLNSSFAVPKNSVGPFHLATGDPWGDLAEFDGSPQRNSAAQARRINDRGCVVAIDAGMDGGRATALPWQAVHEAPGWWDRLVRQYFSGAEVSSFANWDAVISALLEVGPYARGVVWVRRELNGVEATGHLMYATINNGQFVLLDGQTGGLGRMEKEGIRQLVLARFSRGRPSPDAHRSEWRIPAEDFASAVRKADAWLDEVYGGQVALVDASPADETRRGWLFACNTKQFLAGGDLANAMLDASIVVPKDHQEPFGLPNSDPWGWFSRWVEGAQPGVDGQTLPPKAGPAAWMPDTMRKLGPILSISEHSDWAPLLAELATLPEAMRALVWVRRQDWTGRESVGLLLNAARTANGVVLIDGMRDGQAELEVDGLRSLHLIRYR